MRAQRFTEQEAKEIGSNVRILNDWADVMQALWEASIAFFKITDNKRVFPKNGENEILLGDEWIIKADLVNNEFVSVKLIDSEDSIEFMDMRYLGDVNPICKCVGVYLKQLINL